MPAKKKKPVKKRVTLELIYEGWSKVNMYKCNNGNGCNRLDSCLTGECWTEYFEKGDKP